jgi:membrane associated rhomboid family serine protease
MEETTESTESRGPVREVQVLFGLVALLWLVEIVDSVFLDSTLQRQGIQPRTLSGIDGILWAPFLHGTFGHLISNTIPLIVVGGLVMMRGLRRWAAVSLIIMLVGGLAVWLFARTHVHIGVSILIFGYLGYLLVVGFLDNDLLWKAVGIGVFVFYGGAILAGILPIQRGISWEGHLFGLGAGVLSAFLLKRPG